MHQKLKVSLAICSTLMGFEPENEAECKGRNEK